MRWLEDPVTRWCVRLLTACGAAALSLMLGGGAVYVYDLLTAT